MCRFLSVSAAAPVSLAELGPDLIRFAELSSHHGDGWGIGTPDEIVKEPVAATDSTAFAAATREVKGRDLVLHLRKASCTTENRRCDTHPWLSETRFGPVVFAHNGHIFDLPALDDLVHRYAGPAPFAHTDSGRFLNLVAGLMTTRSIPQALAQAVTLVEDTTTHVSLNCVLVTRDGLWVMQATNPTVAEWPVPEPPVFDAFTLLQRQISGVTVVASNGWEPETTGWEPLPNRQIRYFSGGQLVNIYDLPAWNPGVNPVPSEELLVNPH